MRASVSCTACGKRRRQRPWQLCQRCRAERIAIGAKTAWRRRRQRAAPLGIEELGARLTRCLDMHREAGSVDLDKLMADADRAAAKALEAAGKIKR